MIFEEMDFTKEDEYIENKFSAPSYLTINIIKKILYLEELFKNNDLYSIKQNIKYNISGILNFEYLEKANIKTFGIQNIIYNNEYFNIKKQKLSEDNLNLEKLNDINLYIPNNYDYFDLTNNQFSQFINIQQKIEKIIDIISFGKEINRENRYDIYFKALHFTLEKNLHQYIPDFIDSLKNNTHYTLKVDVFGEKITFFTNNYNNLYYIEDEDIAFMEDLEDKYYLYKKIQHIQKLFNKIPYKNDEDYFYIMNFHSNGVDLSEVIHKKENLEKYIFSSKEKNIDIEEGLFIIEPKDIESSIINIIEKFQDYLSEDRKKEIARKMISIREQYNIKKIILKTKNIETVKKRV